MGNVVPHQSEEFELVVAERDELRAELADLRVELTELRDRSADYWLSAVRSEYSESVVILALRNSVSWRITKPLRLAQGLRLKIKRVGVLRAVRLSGSYFQNRLANKKRG